MHGLQIQYYLCDEGYAQCILNGGRSLLFKRGSKFVQIKLTIIMFCHASVGLKEPLILILLKQQDNRKSWMCWGAGNFGHISTRFLPLSSLNEPLNRMTAVDKKKTVLYTPPIVLKWLSY